MLQPIFLKSVYKEYIWGGNNIEKYFNRNLEGKKVAESWELSAHNNGLSIIENGEFEGKTLLELFNDNEIRKNVFGFNCKSLDRFPVLIKLIDATDKLSIQVHPNDEYAQKYENDSGKTEIWYVIDCKDNAKIIYGLNSNSVNKTNKEIVENIEEYIQYVDVKKGDFIIIPAGTVHAILDGILICEVQQSSDVTYRVYDWNRIGKDGKARELHIEKAIDVIEKEHKVELKNYSNISENVDAFISKYFNVQIIKIKDFKSFKSMRTSFEAYTIIEGEGKLIANDFNRNISCGDTFLIPAELGEYQISGKLKAIKVWI